MKFAEKVKYFKKGEQRAEKMLDHFGIDQLEHDTIEYKSNLIKYFFLPYRHNILCTQNVCYHIYT